MKCPKCGMEDNDERIDPVTEFLIGYGCYVCGNKWTATGQQREAHNDKVHKILEKAYLERRYRP